MTGRARWDQMEADQRKASAIRAEKQYREGIKLDVEGVATRAKIMTNKPVTKLTNDQVRQANKEYDDMDYREGKKGNNKD